MHSDESVPSIDVYTILNKKGLATDCSFMFDNGF